MAPFDPKNVHKAIGEIPSWATDRIRLVLARAQTQGIAALADACEKELALREGMLPMTAKEAEAARKIADSVAGKPLEEVIELAFRYTKVDADEARFIRWIAVHPGASYQEAEAAFGKKGLSLWVGHLVYNRFGFFRSFLSDVEKQSDLLIDRTSSEKGMHYTLRLEALAAFRRLELV